MTESDTTCPDGFVEQTITSNGIRTCGNDIILGDVELTMPHRSVISPPNFNVN